MDKSYGENWMNPRERDDGNGARSAKQSKRAQVKCETFSNVVPMVHMSEGLDEILDAPVPLIRPRPPGPACKRAEAMATDSSPFSTGLTEMSGLPSVSGCS